MASDAKTRDVFRRRGWTRYGYSLLALYPPSAVTICIINIPHCLTRMLLLYVMLCTYLTLPPPHATSPHAHASTAMFSGLDRRRCPWRWTYHRLFPTEFKRAVGAWLDG